MSVSVPSETVDALREVWERARNEAERARQLMREAEAHFNYCKDMERSAWVALKDDDCPTPGIAGRRAPRKQEGRT